MFLVNSKGEGGSQRGKVFETFEGGRRLGGADRAAKMIGEWGERRKSFSSFEPFRCTSYLQEFFALSFFFDFT